MRESVKAVSIFVLCISAVAAAFVWSDDRPTQSTWMWRIGLSLLAVGAIAVFLKVHFWFKADLAPDFLGKQCKAFFEQNGLCFSLYMVCEDGICVINAMFQNRYDRPRAARIALRPVAGVFGSAVGPFRNDFATIVFDISCGPGAFGIAGIPLPVTSRHQGKKLTLQVGASVDCPEGKGKPLRFREGSLLRYDADFHSSYMTTLQILYFFCGGLLFSFPASTTLRLPSGVAESIPKGQGQRTRTLWKLGDEVV